MLGPTQEGHGCTITRHVPMPALAIGSYEASRRTAAAASRANVGVPGASG